MKIAVVYPDDFSVWHFHRHLLRSLMDHGHDVYAVTAPGKYVRFLNEMGVSHIEVPFQRFMNPVDDFRLILRLKRLYKQLGFDAIHNFTVKANVYSAVAAYLAGVPLIIGTVEGLGFVYAESPSFKLRLLRPVVDLLYRLSYSISSKYWFVNPDDLQQSIRNGLSPEKGFLTKSAGVNIKEYSPGCIDPAAVSRLKVELAIAPDDVVVTMVLARMVWSKGVKEYLNSAEAITKRNGHAKFLLIGPTEPDSPEAVPESYIRDREKTTAFKWLGFRGDIKNIYAISDIVVLPSWYREGVPNVLLESMAMGKPIITTNSVGCREVIDHEKNGYMVPPRNAEALIDATQRLILDAKLRQEFGAYGRRKAELEFDKFKIIDGVIRGLYTQEQSKETRQRTD